MAKTAEQERPLTIVERQENADHFIALLWTKFQEKFEAASVKKMQTNNEYAAYECVQGDYAYSCDVYPVGDNSENMRYVFNKVKVDYGVERNDTDETVSLVTGTSCHVGYSLAKPRLRGDRGHSDTAGALAEVQAFITAY